MPWIKVFSLDEATGLLKKEYEAAIKRAGRIWHIVSIMWSQWYPLIWAGDGSVA
jgi:hypothetical protein